MSFILYILVYLSHTISKKYGYNSEIVLPKCLSGVNPNAATLMRIASILESIISWSKST